MTGPDQGATTPGREPASSRAGFREPGIQDGPRRPVALKVVKGDFAGPEALRRFQFEAQILARLRHPGFARIYEAGTHDDGNGPVPFFAKVNRSIVRALDGPGTPWLVLSRDGFILWESDMDAPAPLVSNMLNGIQRHPG
jgi:serine/threonine protein kinase